MIMTQNKERYTLGQLANENGTLTANLKANIQELYKRKEELKLELAKNNFESKLLKQRKIFAWRIDECKDDKTDIIRDYIIHTIEGYGNKIKEFYILNKFIYIKVKYNQLISDERILNDSFKLTQIDPKFIIKKQDNYIK